MTQKTMVYQLPFSANEWTASQALTRMSSSGELRSSTAVAGFLLSKGNGSNCVRRGGNVIKVWASRTETC